MTVAEIRSAQTGSISEAYCRYAEALVSLCSDTSRCVEVLNTSLQKLEVCCFSVQ